MVRTRSRARQEAVETTLHLSSEEEGPPAARPAATSLQKTREPVARLEHESDSPSLEELALRAFQVMQRRLGAGLSVSSDEEEMESETDAQPDILQLDGDDRKPSAYSKKRTTAAGTLATSLQPLMKEKPYFSFDHRGSLASSSSAGRRGSSWEERDEDLMKRSVITSDFEKRDSAPPMYVSKYAKAKARKASRESSTGRGWYEMGAPEMTSELRNDLKLLRMRNALNPSRHYKASDWKKLPRYFQVGQVVSGAAEFYSGRIPRKERKSTIMDELLQDHQFRRYHKKKFSELQKKFTSGTRRKRLIKHKKHFKK